MPIPQTPPGAALRGLGAAAVPPLGGDVIADGSTGTGTEHSGQGKAALMLTLPCGRGQGIPVLALCPGAQAEPLGAGCS